ncbi:hypothetical protein ASG89_29105 [Paenibacillus sp. Soil766]|uniref:flagellar protein FlgN n=1 Tax=Paenibacillus sp. Soil766 TaxID=1736404 RepID=UPI0007097D5F|nr:flagellar protein FlgN [Paenibacillus sp. Soil766]KRE97964.1 hypothetical protein ASG89_29105 [Paenibacillus sp. Soil766]
MSIQPLLETMDKLQEAHEALLELAKVKTQVLVSNDIDQLNMIVNRETKWVRAIADVNQERIQFIGSYLISRGYNPNPKITISDLIKIIFKAEEKQALAFAQKRLSIVLEELRVALALNKDLLQQSLLFIDYSLDIVAGSPDDDVVYHNPGQPSHGIKRPGLFDTRA